MTRVLVVDDRPVFVQRLSRLLTRAGLSVVATAGDITEAEDQVRLHRPDLAVVDLMLPGISGMEGTERLKALAPELRVILVSVHAKHIDLLRAAAADMGAEDFVSKEDLNLKLVRGWAAPEPELKRT